MIAQATRKDKPVMSDPSADHMEAILERIKSNPERIEEVVRNIMALHTREDAFSHENHMYKESSSKVCTSHFSTLYIEKHGI